MNIHEVLKKSDFTHEELVFLLESDVDQRQHLYKKALEVKDAIVGNKVYFRGLIEFSNVCAKNCYYCGIRRSNKRVERYYLTEQEVLDAAVYAHQERFASLVIQAGERSDKQHVATITSLLEAIHRRTNNEMHITLSLGEQSEETYRQWFNAGAHRYLLRIEETDQVLYRRLHPEDKTHDFAARIACLDSLRKVGFQVGTGVMIGLPFQTIPNLADNLLFFKDYDIDMAGMGPYIEHEDTPLWEFRHTLLPRVDRFDLSMKMIALLRIMMPDINIAATTAMQAIDPIGREKALKVGANVIMPNLTPVKYREGYLLYDDKPCVDEEADECKNCLEARIKLAGAEIGYGEWGDSLHYRDRKGS